MAVSNVYRGRQRCHQALEPTHIRDSHATTCYRDTSNNIVCGFATFICSLRTRSVNFPWTSHPASSRGLFQPTWLATFSSPFAYVSSRPTLALIMTHNWNQRTDGLDRFVGCDQFHFLRHEPSVLCFLRQVDGRESDERERGGKAAQPKWNAVVNAALQACL